MPVLCLNCKIFALFENKRFLANQSTTEYRTVFQAMM